MYPVKSGTFARRAALLFSTLLLASCATRTPTPVAVSAPYTAAVKVAASDTQAAVEAKYSASVVVWHPEAGFAVLALTHPLSGLRALSVKGVPAVSEPNAQMFEASGTASAWSGHTDTLHAQGQAYVWSGGQAYVWSGGQAYVWSGGQAYVWSGGQAYVWSGGANVPFGLSQNVAAWNQIGLPTAWSAAPNLGEAVKVAVIDSGIDLNHAVFQGSLADPADRWDFVDNDAVPQDEGTFTDGAFGHGTEVAGIVLQVAPHAKIMPLRVLAPDGSGDQTTVAQAIDFAVRHGAQVINLSLGSTEATETIRTMIDYATSQGVNVTSSSGNTGDTAVTYPARYARDAGTAGDLSISVGSVGAQDTKSAFSTYGESVELVAPGEQVWGPVPGNLMSFWSGTSMAAPMVAGALALARGQHLNTTPAAMTAALVNSGTAIDALNPSYTGKLGRRLNVGVFLQALTQP